MKTQVRARHAVTRTEWIDQRLANAAFVAATPIDQPLDDLTNVNVLKELVGASAIPRKNSSRVKADARPEAAATKSATPRTRR